MIKVATWSAEKNGADFFEIFRQMQADIFCVQDGGICRILIRKQVKLITLNG